MGRSWRPWRKKPVADADAVAALLDDVRRLHFTLTADLAAAAGALEADEPEIARDIIEADCVEVRKMAGGVAPVRTPAPVRRSKALLALPAIPLVGALAITGAAAMNGGGTPSASHPHHQVAAPAATITPSQVSETAATTLHQLERVVGNHSKGARVVALAAHLHNQLTAIIATSPNSPTRIGEVQHLLAVEQKLLEGHHGDGTAIALAASRKLTHLLKVTALPTIVPSSLPPIALLPTKSPTPKPTKSTPKPQTSKTPTAKPTPTTKRTHAQSPHRHRHHHHLSNPLLGPGLLNNGL